MQPKKPKNLRNILINTKEWEAAKKRAKATYDHVCAMCGIDLDSTAKPYTYNSIEIDHIVPIARGGHPTELSNLQLSCMKCNRNKGTKMASDYDGMDLGNPFPQSRDW